MGTAVSTCAAWIIGVVLLTVFSICAISNMLILLLGSALHWRTSMVPLIGGLAGALGAVVLPVPGVSHDWWVFPIVDVGCVPMALCGSTYAAYVYLKERRRRNRP